MTNKICLVTGVGGATGASIAHRFGRQGYRVAMLARNRERLTRLEEEIEGCSQVVKHIFVMWGILMLLLRQLMRFGMT